MSKNSKFSWKTVDGDYNSIYKIIDSSCFSTNSSTIDQEFYSFFRIVPNNTDKIFINLIDEQGNKYKSYIRWVRPSSPVRQIHWYKEFKTYLQNKISFWEDIETHVTRDYPRLYFTRIDQNSYKVSIETGNSSVVSKKIESQNTSDLVVGNPYSKKFLSEFYDEIGVQYLMRGLYYFEDKTLLFVTLDQSKGLGNYFNKNKFIWSSMDEMDQNSKRLIPIFNKDIEVLLFIRITDKIKGKTQPYIYSGKLDYLEHDKSTNNPVLITFDSLDYEEFDKSDDLIKINNWFIDSMSFPEKDEKNEKEVQEGKVVYRLHKQRERKGTLPLEKKRTVFKELGYLECEVCGFNFQEIYGQRGIGFIECHHNKFVSELEDEQTIKLSDLSLLCSNCHRMIHTKKPWLSVEELKEIINKD